MARMKEATHRQLDLFEAPAPRNEGAGTLNIREAVLETVTAMMKASPLSREQIAERMAGLTGTRITPVMLNAWTAESRTAHRFPFEFAPALEAACGSRALTNLMAELAGGEIYYGMDALKARLGVLEIEKAHLAGRIRSLKEKARTA